VTDPVLHLLVGPNGAGKTTLFEQVIEAVTHLEFVNADRIAAERWPGDEERHGHDASDLAARRRSELFDERRSFVSETVFSHPSKVDLVRDAKRRGYLVTLHVVVVPVELTVARVAHRVARGGHSVPEDKIRARYDRLWPYVTDAVHLADHAFVYDNSRARTPHRLVATFDHGRLVGAPSWPAWTPAPLTSA
jgi:predicted ABC-type ATPase